MSGTYAEDTNPINVYTRESIPWNVGAPFTLAEYYSGPGVVESFQIAENGRNFNAILNIQIDGGTIISISSPAFFGFSLDPISTNPSTIGTGTNTQYNPNIICGVSNRNYIGQCSNYWGCKKRVFIPFTKSIQMYLTGNDTACTINSQVIYRKWPSVFPLYYSIGQRRKYWNVLQAGTWGTPISISQFGTYNTTAITGVGQIEFITHVLWNVNPSVSGDNNCKPITCQEGEYTLNIDGKVNTYGRSDNFWGGQTYFGLGSNSVYGKTLRNGPDCGLFTYQGQAWQGAFNMHGYRFFYDKPIFFNTSFSLGWTCGNTTRSSFGNGITGSSNIFLISYWLQSQ